MDFNNSNPSTYALVDQESSDIRISGNPTLDCNYSYQYQYQGDCRCDKCSIRCRVHSKITANLINQNWSRMSKATWTNTARHRFKTM